MFLGKTLPVMAPSSQPCSPKWPWQSTCWGSSTAAASLVLCHSLCAVSWDSRICAPEAVGSPHTLQGAIPSPWCVAGPRDVLGGRLVWIPLGFQLCCPFSPVQVAEGAGGEGKQDCLSDCRAVWWEVRLLPFTWLVLFLPVILPQSESDALAWGRVETMIQQCWPVTCSRGFISSFSIRALD